MSTDIIALIAVPDQPDMGRRDFHELKRNGPDIRLSDMTYIHLAAGLIARDTVRPVGQHEARDFRSRKRAKRRTSGPIPTSAAGVWLRDRAEPVVVFCLEQLVEGRRYRDLLQRSGTMRSVSTRKQIVYRAALVGRSEKVIHAFHQTRPATPADWVPRRDERRERSPRFLQGMRDCGGRRQRGLTSSDDDDVVLRVGQDAVGGGILEVREEERLLGGAFRGLEDEEGGDDGEDGEVRFRVEGRGHGWMCGCAAHACTLEANNWILPPLLGFSSYSLAPAFLRSGTTPDTSERLASRQSHRRLDPLGFFFPKRRRTAPPSSPDPSAATTRPSSTIFHRLRTPSRSSTVPAPQQPPPPRTATMTAAPTFDHYRPQSPAVLHAKNNLKTWWERFTAQKARREAGGEKGVYPFLFPSWISPYLFTGIRPLPPRPSPSGPSVVFGKPLKESLKFASVQISTANGNGELYVWGYIPVVVAKSCVPFTLPSHYHG